MKYPLIALALAASLASPAFAQSAAPAPAAPAAAAATSVSFQTSTIGVLLKDPQARPVFEKNFPDVVNHPQIGDAADMTLADIREFVPAMTAEKLAAMDAELKAAAGK